MKTQLKQYFFPKQIINQMDVPFTIKLATTDPDDIVREQLKIVTQRIDSKLHQIDLDFSPFRYESLVSRFQRGDRQPLLDSSEFQSVYAQSILAEQMTDGIFTPYFAGRFDPTGLIKGWAIERVFDELLKPLLKDSQIEGVFLKGDSSLKLATKQKSDFRWRIEIKNPDNFNEVIATYYLKDGAIATFKSSQSGERIIHMNQSEVRQATVISNSLVDADVWANVGVSTRIEKFTGMINEYNLSGLLVDNKQNPLNFSDGAIANLQETSL